MPAGTDLGLLAKDSLPVDQSLSFETRAADLGADFPSVTGGIGKVDPAVVTIIRMQDDIEQAALTTRGDFRQATYRFGQQAAVLHDTQPTRPFSDQDATIGQKGHRPRMLQPVGHCHRVESDIRTGNR